MLIGGRSGRAEQFVVCSNRITFFAILMRANKLIVDPPITRTIFSETGAWTWVWAVVRVYVGLEWLKAGWHKVTDPAWMAGGTALKAFFERIIVVPPAPARPAISYDWYREFISMLLEGGHYAWFAKLVALGEVFVGVCLILGAFVGVAAFFGAVMNFNFMLAGTASTNPVLFLCSVLLMLAWKTAGYWGADRWLLPSFGTPWRVSERDIERSSLRDRQST